MFNLEYYHVDSLKVNSLAVQYGGCVTVYVSCSSTWPMTFCSVMTVASCINDNNNINNNNNNYYYYYFVSPWSGRTLTLILQFAAHSSFEPVDTSCLYVLH